MLNGPVASAFIAAHSPAERMRAGAVARIPIPAAFPADLPRLVEEYSALVEASGLDADGGAAAALLSKIDAAVLSAYDLSPRVERELFAFFQDTQRPVAHPWQHWDDAYPVPGLRLSERLSGRYRPEGPWVPRLFRPLPPEEAELLRAYQD